MSWYKIAQTTKEMEDWFRERTNRHIDLVRKYCQKLADYDAYRFGELYNRGIYHDISKFEEPEIEPYVYITWQYKCKDKGEKFDISQEIKDKMSKATEHHVKNNPHHPEFHCEKEVGLINRENRDKPPQEIIDATKMTELDIGEMVADWLAMSEEKNSNPKDWADKNINVRWKFTGKQKGMIYELIDEIWKQGE
jgi:hypothetical protein